jgi:hypothetical protein
MRGRTYDRRKLCLLSSAQLTGESRVARESVRGLLRPDGLAPWRRPVLAPVRPAPGRAAPRRAPEERGRAAHGPATHGSTACRMRSAYRLRGFATTAASPLRRRARADAYRGPLGLAPLSMPRGGRVIPGIRLTPVNRPIPTPGIGRTGSPMLRLPAARSDQAPIIPPSSRVITATDARGRPSPGVFGRRAPEALRTNWL